MKALLLAWRYICFHRWKTVLMIACISLTIALPIAIHLLLKQFNEQIVARADATPVVIGAKGSRLDLTLSALYLQKKNDQQIRYGDANAVVESGFAEAVPIHLGYRAQGYAIVGTNLNYFGLRDLKVADGTTFRRLGDCVLGAQVAKEQGIAVGDFIKSDRTNSLDIASNPPLYMRVTGILEPSKAADDRAVFVDLKTAWVIDGLGHGHEDVTAIDEKDGKVLNRDGKTTTASAMVIGEFKINEANIGSFHFHGDMKDYPITAVVAIPNDQRSLDLLKGRYLAASTPLQLVEPSVVVRDLMGLVFRAKQFFDANSIIISMATFLLMVMVVILSLKLRQREMETMFKIGCSKLAIVKLQMAELFLIGVGSAVVVSILVAMIWLNAGNIVQSLLISG